MNAKPAPMLERLLKEVVEMDACKTVVDLGCGQLRHLDMLLRTFESIVLVDTPRQLSRELRFKGGKCTIADHIASLPARVRRRVTIVDSEGFAKSRSGVDVVLTVNTFDVVPAMVRDEMCSAAYRNLRAGGLLGIIVPRNDTSITGRCTEENRFLDGHVFEHHGLMTFFRNFRNHQPLVSRIERLGAELVSDISVYRHICLLLRKTGQQKQ